MKRRDVINVVIGFVCGQLALLQLLYDIGALK